ncbi:MAG: hypothetical protein JWN56_2435 [Sphingobacteriales bacterium]|nr:hypothetical protein [Sphingobacteriales bacterium]
MSLEKINVRAWVIILMIICASALRLAHLGTYSSWMNFSPIGAMAMFGGAYYKDKLMALFVTFLSLFVGDVFLNYTYFNKLVLFYDGAGYVYLSFFLMVLIGTYIKKVNVQNVVIASLASVLVHWLITDIEPCVRGMYPATFNGYIQSLTMALPYEKNLLFGNLVFGAIMFGGFEFAKNKFSVLSKNELAYK